jgi:toxin YoeB
MKTAWTEAAWHDYLHWSHADQRMRARIDELIRDIKGVPFKGLGRPEPLQYGPAGLELPPHLRRAPAGVSRFR